MMGQYRKIRGYPTELMEKLDALVPGWDEKTEPELTSYVLCTLLAMGDTLMKMNRPVLHGIDENEREL